MAPNLLFVAPHTLVVRNWVSTGLADLCAKELGLTPVFLSHFADECFHSPDGAAFRNIQFPLEQRGKYEVPAGFSRALYAAWVMRMRTYALELTDGSLQYMDFARRRDAGHVVGLAASRILPRGSRRRTLVRTLIDSVNPRHPFAESVLDRVQPTGMIVGSPGFILLDQLMMAQARRRRLPVHCVVNSWDNMTSRGPMIRRPDSLMVWNEHMKEQAAAIHDYPPDRTFVVGSLQFTGYGAPVTGDERADIYRRLQLPDGVPYFLFLTGQHVADYETEDLRVLLDLLRETRHRDVPVVVRLHPQVDPRPFSAVARDGVVFDCPPRFTDRGDQGSRFGPAEIRQMAALLSGAQLVIASWGTTALLEAAIFDRPMIQLRWMKAFKRQAAAQASRVIDFQRYLHLRPFDATGCRLFSESPETLAQTIEDALLDPGGRERRERAVSLLTTPPLGMAPTRVVDVLSRHLNGMEQRAARFEPREVRAL